jgi:hypothetical protein
MAEFSEDKKYRYYLLRGWAVGGNTVVFIGLNPSTADEQYDDPTVRRCIGFARRWGFSEMVMLNIFAFRSTDPFALEKEKDPVGPKNDLFLREFCKEADLVVFAWGTHGDLKWRGIHTAYMIKQTISHDKIRCLGINSDQSPKHPLYLKRDTQLVPY